jgi:hypothetical protein
MAASKRQREDATVLDGDYSVEQEAFSQKDIEKGLQAVVCRERGIDVALMQLRVAIVQGTMFVLHPTILTDTAYVEGEGDEGDTAVSSAKLDESQRTVESFTRLVLADRLADAVSGHLTDQQFFLLRDYLLLKIPTTRHRRTMGVGNAVSDETVLISMGLYVLLEQHPELGYRGVLKESETRGLLEAVEALLVSCRDKRLAAQ